MIPKDQKRQFMSLIGKFATVGGATLSSRVLGFVRDILIAASLGTGPIADAFFVAFRLPNLFRRLFAEGAFNAAFIPLFAKALEEDGREGARSFAEDILSGLFFTLVIFTVIAEITMPFFMYLLAPGFADDAAKWELTIYLTRIAFPYLMFMSLIAFFGGILNTFNRFAVAAFAPVLLNVVLISALFLILSLGYSNSPKAGLIMAIGVSFAGWVQFMALLWDVKRAKFVVELRWPRWTPNVKRLLVLGLPGVVAGGITQINIQIGTIIASMQDAAVSYLYYADRIYQLPLGVVGIAIGVVLLPNLSRSLKAGDDTASQAMLNRSLEFAAILTLPAAIALMLVPGPIVQVLFERGAFDARATAATALALTAFAAGLPAFVLNKVLSPGFFAREDTRTPMRYAGYAMVINVGLSLALFPLLQHVGIAIATAVAGWVNTALLGITLYRRGHFRIDRDLMKRIGLMLVASLGMGAVVFLLGQVLAPYLGADLLAVRIAALGGLVLGGMVAYGIIVLLTGALSLGEIKAMLRRRKTG